LATFQPGLAINRTADYDFGGRFSFGLRSGPVSQAAILSFDGCSLDQKQRDGEQVLRVKYSIAGFNCDIGGS
jgi:hypothetical protein